jgi:hypothetical protein
MAAIQILNIAIQKQLQGYGKQMAYPMVKKKGVG